MLTRNLLFAAAASLSFAACSSAQMDSAAAGLAMPADPTPEERGPYVMMAASSDMYEIQSGQLAQQRSQNGQVRQFGAMLVQHHTQTTQQLMAAAQASGTPMPSGMMPLHAEMLRRLQAASAADFNRMFQMQQVMAHEMALALHRNYGQNGDAPALRQTAMAATPIIQQHLNQARTLPR
jgi:putative membrane protein